MSARTHAAVAGVGSVLPERVVPNSSFEATLDTSDEWIRERTGIRERRFARDDQVTSDLAVEATRLGLEAAGISADQVDLIVCATLSGDTPIPSTAVWVQRKLGIACPAFDVNAACAGFSYAMSTGTAFIESGAAETIVVIGAEVLSRVLDMTDRGTCILFGDGAGAVVLRPSASPGVIGSVLGADGRSAEILIIPAGGSLRPASHETVDQRLHYVKQEGATVFKFAVKNTEEIARRLLERNGLQPSHLDLFVSHQANRRIIEAATERLGLGPEKVIINLEMYGNTTAGTIPLALADARRLGRLKKGDLVLLCSVGAGFTVGAVLLRWSL